MRWALETMELPVPSCLRLRAQIFPAYIFPLLNGFSIICLATQKTKPTTLDIITNIFGGSDGNEGLGLLNLSFDWQYLGSR